MVHLCIFKKGGTLILKYVESMFRKDHMSTKLCSKRKKLRDMRN